MKIIMERVKPINCFNIKPNMYFVSENGNIYNKNKKLSPAISKDGYLKVCLRTIENQSCTFSVHRIVASMFCIYKNGDTDVNHINGVKTYNHYTNLEWCTHKENMVHCVNTGLFTTLYGEDNGNSTLTNSQVHDICKLLEQNMKYSDIINILGLEQSRRILDIITKIRCRKLWVHISSLYNIPNPEKRNPVIHYYTDEELHQMCKLISKGYSNNEIYNIVFSDFIIDRNMKKSVKNVLSNLRSRRKYIRISKNYKW